MNKFEYEERLKEKIIGRNKNKLPGATAFRTNLTILAKLEIIAEKEGRTLNKQLEEIAKNAIINFEKTLESDKI